VLRLVFSNVEYSEGQGTCSLNLGGDVYIHTYVVLLYRAWEKCRLLSEDSYKSRGIFGFLIIFGLAPSHKCTSSPMNAPLRYKIITVIKFFVSFANCSRLLLRDYPAPPHNFGLVTA
jgi:hypothetical protein